MPVVGARGTASRGYFGGGTKPFAPTITSSAQGVASLSISFTEPEFNGGLVITKYEHAVSTDNITWTPFSAASSSTTPPTSPVGIQNLTNGQPYYVKIRAVNGLGAGPDSNTWSTTTTPRTVPNAPSITSLTRGYRQLVVAFSAPTFNGGSAVTDYEYSVNGGTIWASMGQSGTTSYAITGLADFIEYSVRIRAVNVAGSGTQSLAVAQYTAGAPGTVAGVGATSNASTQSVVSWTAPNTNGTPITDYTIQYSTSSTFASSITNFSDGVSTSVSTTVTGLSNGTTYYFRVKAVNAVGESSSWSAISAGAVPATAPNAPVIGTATASDRSVTINWTASTAPGGAPVTYTIALWNNIQGWYTTSTSTGTSKSFTARNDRSYIGRVYASSSAGSSGYSDNSNQVSPAMVIPTMNWVDSSATKYSDWSMSWTGASGYSYQPQKYYTSWADFGASQSGSGAKTSDSFTVGYTGTVYGRIKVTDPDGVVGYTNQRYVTAGRAAGSDPDTYAWNAWAYATGSYSGNVVFDTSFNGAGGGGNNYVITNPTNLSDNDEGALGSRNGAITYVYAVRLRMERNNTGTFDLTSTTQTNTSGRKVFFYGPGGLAMRCYGGTTLGQNWGQPDQTSDTKWTGTALQEHTWYVDATVTGNLTPPDSGYTALKAPGNNWYVSGSNEATTVYSSFWGSAASGAATKVTVTVYYARGTRTYITYANDYAATNSVYG